MAVCGASRGGKGAAERLHAVQGAGQPRQVVIRPALTSQESAVSDAGQVLCNKPHNALRSACFPDEQAKGQDGGVTYPGSRGRSKQSQDSNPGPSVSRALSFNPRLCFSGF